MQTLTALAIFIEERSVVEPTNGLEFSVVMPCLNEAVTLGLCVRNARDCFTRLRVCGEVVVADNGSTDGSQSLAMHEGARVVRVVERGYGSALFHGCNAARGRCIIIGDSDGSYDFSRLDAFVSALEGGAEVVIGNRFAGGIAPGAMPWKNRYIGTPILSFIGRLFFRSPVTDFNCGMRGFTKAAFLQMDLQTVGMEFASEMIVKATLLGLRVEEVPTTLSRDGRLRKPHLRPWRDGWRHLRFMLLYSPRWLFFYPGIVLMIVGLLGGGLLQRGPILIRPGVGLDVHTLLFAFAAVILGFEAVSFAVFARLYASSQGLLPPPVASSRLERLLSKVSLEIGLTVGALLLLLGLGGVASAVTSWAAVGFGNLDPRTMLRTAIPSVTAICLGAQIVLTSFLLSLLRLRRRNVVAVSERAANVMIRPE